MQQDTAKKDNGRGDRPAALTGEFSHIDRNFLAWIRTSVSFLLFGLAVDKFNIFVSSLAYLTRKTSGLSKQFIDTYSYSSSFANREGMYIIFIGAIVGVFGLIQYRARAKLLLERIFYIDHLMDVLITVAVLAIGVLFLLNLVNSFG